MKRLYSFAKFASGLLVLVLSFSGCSLVKQATSEAYNLGYQTGEGLRVIFLKMAMLLWVPLPRKVCGVTVMPFG